MDNAENCRVFLFGQAEKGAYCTPLVFTDLEKLSEILGEPPDESVGVACAIQCLLFQRELIFFRVHEEGFSYAEYLLGMQWLRKQRRPIAALALPGVGDGDILQAATELCLKKQALLLLSERDLYDWVTG